MPVPVLVRGHGPVPWPLSVGFVLVPPISFGLVPLSIFAYDLYGVSYHNISGPAGTAIIDDRIASLDPESRINSPSTNQIQK